MKGTTAAETTFHLHRYLLITAVKMGVLWVIAVIHITTKTAQLNDQQIICF